MKKKWIVGTSIVTLVVAVVVVLIIFLAQSHEKPKNLNDIINKEVPLAEGILYCDGIGDETLNDDFSKVYSQAVKINVESIDETAMVTKVTIVALPLRDILESCLPESSNGDYDAVFASYMSDVYDAIRECPEENKVSTTIECKVVENNGLKLVPNNDFTEAMFPNIQQLLAELMLDLLSTREG